MCGITGIVSFEKSSADIVRKIKKMTNIIKHRGPDDEGFLLVSEQETVCAAGDETPSNVKESSYVYSPSRNINTIPDTFSLAFGHRRLSIIDLSAAGHQPMCSNDKNLWITYNGEIYNYIELREDLKSKGYQFITNTDTEVILAAYNEWGENCLLKFNGMWAFVIYNKNKNELFGSRDRFGVKPFYYYQDKNIFAFASEQKALVKSSVAETAVNPKAAFDFLVKGQLEYEEEGMFKNIFELFPSHAFKLNVKSGEFKKWQFYSLNYNPKYEDFSEKKFNDATEQVKQLLTNAVALRLRSDVKVGSCLSGGIDSSAIVGILSKKKLVTEQDVYTASFNDSKYDESGWAKKMVDATGAKWYRIFPDAQGLQSDIENLIYSQDIPTWSTSTYAQYKVMQSVKESGVKVVLDGQGGDELFAGYDIYNMFYGIELLKNFKYGQFATEVRADGMKGFIHKYLRESVINYLPSSIHSNIYQNYFNEIDFLNQDFWNVNKNRLTNNSPSDSSLNKVLHKEFFNTRLKQYLKCEDRCSMWHSVESRTPFADDVNLIEYVFNLPSSFKIKNGINKYILREAVKKFIPVEIYERKDKMGYSTPNNSWVMSMKDNMKELFTESLNDYINTEKILKQYDNFFNLAHKPDTGREFRFISFALWKNAFRL